MRNYIFDFNGTLFQDTEFHRRAWRRYRARQGISLTDEQFYSCMCGPPNDVILRQFFGPQLTDAQAAAMAEEKEEIYREIVLSDPANQTLTPGAPEVLEALRAHGIPYAIATSADRPNLEFYLSALHIDRWFDWDHIFSSEGRIPGKPDPAVYRLAMEKLGFAPKDVTVVEDSMVGILSASGAGVDRIIAIDTTLGAEALAKLPQVYAVIHDFYDLEHFIALDECQ